MSDGDKKDDDTQTGGAPPKLPSQTPVVESGPARQSNEAVRVADQPIKQPPVGHREVADAEDDATIILPRDTTQPRLSLNRVRPPGHSDSVLLEGEAYLLGRAPTSDVRLYSASASRDHARLTRRSGDWYLAPCEHKLVLANGAAVLGEVRLEHKMSLQLGDDELLVIDRLAPAGLPASAAVGSATRSRARWWIVLVVAAAVVMMAVGMWLLSKG